MRPKLLVVCSGPRRSRLLEALEGQPLQIDCAAGFVDAQKKLGSEHHYDLLLVDSELHDGRWQALLRLAQGCKMVVPWVVCARLGDHQLWAEALGSGAYDLISEPYEPGEVARIVEGALKSRLARMSCDQ